MLYGILASSYLALAISHYCQVVGCKYIICCNWPRLQPMVRQKLCRTLLVWSPFSLTICYSNVLSHTQKRMLLICLLKSIKRPKRITILTIFATRKNVAGESAPQCGHILASRATNLSHVLQLYSLAIIYLRILCRFRRLTSVFIKITVRVTCPLTSLRSTFREGNI